MLPPNFKTTRWATFWLPCIWIHVSTTTGAPPGTSWCPLWWVLLKQLNCRLLQTEKASCLDNISLKSIMLKYTYYYRVRASRQKEIEKQPIKIEKNPWIHMTTARSKVLSCHSFSIRVLSIVIFSLGCSEVAYMLSGRVPALNIVVSWRTVRCLTALSLFAAHSNIDSRSRSLS